MPGVPRGNGTGAKGPIRTYVRILVYAQTAYMHVCVCACIAFELRIEDNSASAMPCDDTRARAIAHCDRLSAATS